MLCTVVPRLVMPRRLSSSTTMASCRTSPPTAPYSAGISVHRSPTAPAWFHSSRSTWCCSRKRASFGTISASTKRRAASRNRSSSSSIHGERYAVTIDSSSGAKATARGSAGGGGDSGDVEAHHGLDLEELLETKRAPFPAKTGLLVAAERGREIQTLPVQMNVAGADPPRYRARMVDAAGRHIARQAIRRVVGDPYRLLLVGVRQDAEHRPEDLFARDRHIVRHAAEDRRP